MIKLLIVDDQALIREGLATLLGMRTEIEVLGTAINGMDAFEKTQSLSPDIVLMDIRMPGTNGVEGTRLITNLGEKTKVLMLTTFSDSDLIFQCLEHGASGYLLKDMSPDAIVNAIQTVHAGGLVLPPALTAQMLKEFKKAKDIDSSDASISPPKLLDELTEREKDVLKHLGLGQSNKEIADDLFITEGTVKNHVSNIISKLEVRDRTQAAVFAVRYGVTKFE